MSVEALRVRPIEAPEFVELRHHDVLEGTDEPWVKHDLCKAMPQQVSDELPLPLRKAWGTAQHRKRRGKVKVQPDLDPALPGHLRGPLRILHEDHGTHGRDRSPQGAIEDKSGGP